MLLRQTEKIDWLNDFKREHLALAKAQHFPIKNEHWKYDDSFTIPTLTKTPNVSRDEILACINKNKNPNAMTLVTINGQYHPEFSSPENNWVQPIEKACANEACSFIQTYWEKPIDVDKFPLASLNAANFSSGIYLEINQTLSQPIELIHLIVDANCFVRDFVVIKKGVKVALTEKLISLNTTASFQHRQRVLLMEADAALNLLRVQNANSHTTLLEESHIYQQQNATLNALRFDNGCKFAREDVEVLLEGEGASATLNGFYRTQTDHQMIDNHVSVNHLASHTHSKMHYKGILAGKSKAIFNGGVYVESNVKNINSAQLNQNLMLSHQSEVYTKPQLEIYADDVRCVHGATVGELNDDLIFYLNSRGISRQLAETMLLDGFAQEILDKISDQHDRGWVRELC